MAVVLDDKEDGLDETDEAPVSATLASISGCDDANIVGLKEACYGLVELERTRAVVLSAVSCVSVEGAKVDEGAELDTGVWDNIGKVVLRGELEGAGDVELMGGSGNETTRLEDDNCVVGKLGLLAVCWVVTVELNDCDDDV